MEIKSRYKQFWRRVGHTRWFAYAVRYALSRLDRRLYQLSKGRISVAGPPLFSWLLLTTTGRKSGQARTTPLIYIRDGDSLVVTSENFGMAERPAGWRLNLQATPKLRSRSAARSDSTVAGYKAFRDALEWLHVVEFVDGALTPDWERTQASWRLLAAQQQ